MLVVLTNFGTKIAKRPETGLSFVYHVLFICVDNSLYIKYNNYIETKQSTEREVA